MQQTRGKFPEDFHEYMVVDHTGTHRNYKRGTQKRSLGTTCYLLKYCPLFMPDQYVQIGAVYYRSTER